MQCITCLKELLSLMAKDRDVAAFIFRQPSHTFQYARFVDWFRPYLEGEKVVSSQQSSDFYQQAKLELIDKALKHLATLKPVFAEFAQKET